MSKHWAKYLVLGLLSSSKIYAFDEAAVQARIDQDRQLFREMNARPALKKTSPAFDKLDDDGTISAKVAVRQPSKEALKLALKAEKESDKNQHDRAAGHLEEALVVDPGFFEAENNLALELLALKRPDEAIAHFRHIIATHPERVFPYNSLGSVLCEMKRYAEAEAVARDALKDHPLSFTSNLILGLSLAAQGQFTKESKQALQFASAQRPEAKALLAQWPSQH